MKTLKIADLLVAGSRFTLGTPTRNRIAEELGHPVGNIVSYIGEAENGKRIEVADAANPEVKFVIKRANLGSLVGEDGKMRSMVGERKEWKHQPGARRSRKIAPEVLAAQEAVAAYKAKVGDSPSKGQSNHLAKLENKLAALMTEHGVTAEMLAPKTEEVAAS